MTNLISSDLYRLRKGAALRNTLIGLLGLVLFVAVVFLLFSSSGAADFFDSISEMPGVNVTTSDGAGFEQELQEMRDYLPKSGGEFAMEMVSEHFIIFFFLPVIIAVFGADFSAATYRNTLSYETNRTKVYLSKLLLSILCCLGLLAVMILFSWLIGGLFFGGFAGSGAALGRTLVIALLQLPICLGVISFGHCLIACTRKTGATIAAYLLTLIFLSMVVQIAAMLLPISYIALLDWSNAGQMLAKYWEMTAGEILFTVVYGLALAAGCTALGLSRYRSADLA